MESMRLISSRILARCCWMEGDIIYVVYYIYNIWLKTPTKSYVQKITSQIFHIPAGAGGALTAISLPLRALGRKALITPNPQLKLLDQVREVMRLEHFLHSHGTVLW